MNEGYIYCLSNESFPNLLKIGMTDNLLFLQSYNSSDNLQSTNNNVRFTAEDKKRENLI